MESRQGKRVGDEPAVEEGSERGDGEGVSAAGAWTPLD